MSNYVITIGRQHGCGGRLVGRELATRLGIKYCDKEIIKGLIAERCDISVETVNELMERRTSSLLYEMAVFTDKGPLEEQIFIAQSEIVKELAEKESCVFVGCCADYILREYTNKVTVFLYGDIESRIERLVNHYKDTNDINERTLKTIDKKRANYYHFFTTQKWGDKNNYDILVNTCIGVDNVTDMLETIARNRFGGNNIV